jgi:glucokinase
MILAGDVGGTKTCLALYEPGARRREPAASASFASADHDRLESVLDAFLGDRTARVEAAAFGLAGPVVDGVCKVTNLPWTVREDDLASRFGTPRVRLMNDVVATAMGLEWLRDDEVQSLQAGSARARGNLALIAAGTGLGESAVIADGDRRTPLASEGGHADFAPRDGTELDLWRWLHEAHPRIEYEMLVSGPGLVNLYRFFHRGQPHPVLWSGDDEGSPDAAAAISKAAMEGACPACRESLERFVSIYGAEAGNLALRVMATGGVYVGGGIAPKILPVLRDGRFTEAFNAKGAFADLMRSIPVRVILNPETALLGAARVASEL